MTDSELLELSAKAAGYELQDHTVSGDGLWLYGDGKSRGDDGRSIFFWSPLEDDGDAFRLLISCCLDMVLDCYPEKSLDSKRKPFRVRIWSQGWIKEDFDGATAQAISTRRAIVRAAAEIGKSMP